MKPLFLAALLAASALLYSEAYADPDSDARAALALAAAMQQTPGDAGGAKGKMTCPCDPTDPAFCACMNGQCACGPGGTPCAAMAKRGRLQWRPYSDGDVRYVMLWDVGTDAMVGAYTFASGCYCPCGPDGHLMNGTCRQPPIPPPAQPKAVLPATGPVVQPIFPAATYYGQAYCAPGGH